MISALFRFHGHGSLRYVYTKGKAVRSQHVTIKYVLNTRRKQPRFSVVVSKKVIKSAVGRNRIRRRMYEYVRLNQHRLTGVYDIVIICTSPDLRTLPFSQINEHVSQLFTKADLFN